MKRSHVVSLVAFALAFSWATANAERPEAGVSQPPDPSEVEVEIVSQPFHVDGIFKSMMGPSQRQWVSLGTAPPELLWLTGFRVDVVSGDGETPESDDFLCHTNLGWRRQRPRGFHRPAQRVFTLTAGQTDIRLPPGFGIPVLSTERLAFATQVLNLNQPEIDERVRHRTTIRYVPDRDAKQPMKALVQTGAFVMVSLGDEPQVFDAPRPSDELAEHASCEAGVAAVDGSHLETDRFNRHYSAHWVVPPGTHEYKTRVTSLLRIPYDTTIHFIGVHVHPYSKSLELRDLTAGKTVWKSEHQSHTDRIGLAFVDYFSSVEGLPFYRDHEYQMISVYENPTAVDGDAMATMFVYYHDKDFSWPPSGGQSARGPR